MGRVMMRDKGKENSPKGKSPKSGGPESGGKESVRVYQIADKIDNLKIV
jgi:hypothetical protein